MNIAKFDALFDRFTTTVFRLDADTSRPFVATMHDNDDDELVDVEYADSDATVVWRREQRDLALKHAVAVNAYRATGRGVAEQPA